MKDSRWKVWRGHLEGGRVRYRSAEYKCADDECRRWHTVTAKRRNIRYDERNDTLEDLVLNALRTSGTGRCPHKKKRKGRATVVEQGTLVEGPLDDESGTMV